MARSAAPSHGERPGPSVMDLSAYVRETLRNDGELALYRARHPARPGEPSVLLVECVSPRHTSMAARKLEHEYGPRRRSWIASWAARPRALLRRRRARDARPRRPGRRAARAADRRPDGAGSGSCASRSGWRRRSPRCTRRGLIHKDVKPSNVLVDPATRHVRLMGFGIASRLPRERHAPEPPEIIAGTLAYMAPEQTGG